MSENCKECKGCNIKLCLIKHTALIDRCPCSSCLVKSMCSIACELRKRTYVKVTKELNIVDIRDFLK